MSSPHCPASARDVVVGVVGSGSSLTAPLHPRANFLRRRTPSSRIRCGLEGRPRCPSTVRPLEAGEGLGPEGSHFASPGATAARRGRELSCPEEHLEPADRPPKSGRPSTSLLLRHSNPLSLSAGGRRGRRLRKFSNRAPPPPCELPAPTNPFLPHQVRLRVPPRPFGRWRPAKGLVRRAVSSRPPERPRRGGGANCSGPEDQPEPADRPLKSGRPSTSLLLRHCNPFRFVAVGRRGRRLRKFSNHTPPPPCELPAPTNPFLPHHRVRQCWGRPAQGLVRRAVSSRPRSDPARRGRELSGPEEHHKPADRRPSPWRERKIRERGS